MKRKKQHSVMFDALKAYKKACREEEIRLYGKPINHIKVYRNKKKYTRKGKNKRIYDF